MRFAFLCTIVCSIVQIFPLYSAAALNPEWRLDYATGDGVLVDATNKVLERYPLQTVSNLRISPDDPKTVFGDIHYTQKNGHPLTLTFQSPLETKKISYQNDEALELAVFIYQYCFFVCKAYHLPPNSISVIPYEIIPESTTYSDINIDDISLIVTVTRQERYKRPLDDSEYVRVRQITVPIIRTLLRYTYADELRECYPTHHYTATYEGYELLNKEVPSTHPIAHTRLNTMGEYLDLSNIKRIAPDRIAVNVIEEWFRPKTKTPIQLSRRIELPVMIEHSYHPDDANQRSTKSVRSYVNHQASKIIISETSEVIPYEAVVTRHTQPVFRSCDEAKQLEEVTLYQRPDGSLYRKKPTPPTDDDGFVVL